MIAASEEHRPEDELGPRFELACSPTSKKSFVRVRDTPHGTQAPSSAPRGPGAALTGEGTAADAQVVVDELDAVQAAVGAAGAGQALVDVPLTALSSEAGQAAAAVAADPVHALAAVQAVGTPGTVVDVLFTKQACGREGGETVLPALPNTLKSGFLTEKRAGRKAGAARQGPE